MLYTRTDQEKLEEQWLAPYAARSSRTRGRLFEEPHHKYRSEFQRDRDRVIYCRSFRRLEYKTQVFVNGTADHYRTRLTHTIEMTAVARTLARALRVNEDLTEAIALAHDIGHSPFGHCGEQVLNELMANEGGFDHNIQSLRAVEELEWLYPAFSGLNLTWETRAGLRKHVAKIPGAMLDGFPLGPHQYMEAQIADIADDISYQVHDVDDGLEAGLVREEDLRGLEIWRKAEERARESYGDIPENRRLSAIIRALMDMQVEDVINASVERLERFKPGSPEGVQKCSERIVAFTPALKTSVKPLVDLLFNKLYFHGQVLHANEEAVKMMRELFTFYVKHPEDMGKKAQARVAKNGLWRTVCDYIAGMTDRYAFEEYQRWLVKK